MSFNLLQAGSEDLLRELVKWARVGYFTQVRSTLAHVLPEDKDRQIYQMCDGRNTNQAIREKVGVSPNRVSALMRQCESLGLMAANEDGRRLALFDLGDFGLEPTSGGEGRH